jgi:hypothetical protein
MNYYIITGGRAALPRSVRLPAAPQGLLGLVRCGLHPDCLVTQSQMYKWSVLMRGISGAESVHLHHAIPVFSS